MQENNTARHQETAAFAGPMRGGLGTGEKGEVEKPQQNRGVPLRVGFPPGNLPPRFLAEY